MLCTPLGTIEVWIDNKPIPYKVEMLKYNASCANLEGRFSITVKIKPDGQNHAIKCCIKNYKPSSMDAIESGERLVLKSFYSKECKLSIGIEGDTVYLAKGTRISEYDYDHGYLDDGVEFIMLPSTETSIYKFGIAWIDNVNANNDIETWFGADPTLI